MMKRKILTAAVAAATLAAGSAQALTLGHGGTALLVPHVEWDSNVDEPTNTMVQITVGSRNVERQQGSVLPQGNTTFGVPDAGPTSSYQDLIGDPTDFPTLANADPDGAAQLALFGGTPATLSGTNSTENLHWYFFDADSVHIADDDVTVTANDVFLFSWGDTVQALGPTAIADLNGVTGYLVFGSNQARGGGYSEMILWGDAMQISGNWLSAAYIPVLPLNDFPDPAAAVASCTAVATVGCDEVTYNGSYPISVNPSMAGMTLADGDTDAERLVFDIPYFVPLAGGGGIGGETHHVIWLDQNYDGGAMPDSPPGTPYAGCSKANWAGIGIEVFKTDESNNSAVVTFNKELNMINVGTGVIGARTGNPDGDGVTDSGFIWYNAPEASTTGGTCGVAAGTDVHGGVAFALVNLLGGNVGQIQTELAHERGLRPAPAQP